MAGLMNKLGETLHMGGNKEGGKKAEHQGEGHMGTEAQHGQYKTEGQYGGDYKKEGQYGGEEHKKEGMVEKIKDKIHGDKEGGGHGGEEKKKKKKKKDKKNKEHGHDSSSSDSD